MYLPEPQGMMLVSPVQIYKIDICHRRNPVDEWHSEETEENLKP